MKLCIKQRVFSLYDRFYVTDINGEQVYYIESEFFTFFKKFHIYAMSGEEVGYIEQRFNLFLPRLDIYLFGKLSASIQQQFTFLHQEYDIEGPNWHVEGDFFNHEYRITRFEEPIAYIDKECCYTNNAYRSKYLRIKHPLSISASTDSISNDNICRF